MKKTALAFAVGSALILAGCDGTSSPAGAGAGTNESNSSSVSDAMAREKALTVARQQGTAMEVQLTGLIIEAVQELRPRWKGEFDVGLDNTACSVGMEPARKDEARKILEEQTGLPIIPGMELDIFLNGTQDDFNAACLAYLWADVVRPMSGWPRTQARAFSEASNRELAEWGAHQVAFTMAASQALAPIANSLSKLPGATLEQLRQKARELVTQQATAIRQRTKELSLANSQRAAEVSLDFTGSGPAPIHLTLADIDYQRGPAGALLTRHGTTVFGSGYLEGVRYTVEAVATSGQSMTKSTTRTTANDSSNTNTVNAEARTQ